MRGTGSHEKVPKFKGSIYSGFYVTGVHPEVLSAGRLAALWKGLLFLLLAPWGKLNSTTASEACCPPFGSSHTVVIKKNISPKVLF